MPLKQPQPALVEGFHVLIRLGQEPAEARLISSLGKFAIDSHNPLLFADHRSGQLFGKMSALRFVSKHIAELLQCVLNDPGELDDTWHDRTVRECHVPPETSSN